MISCNNFKAPRTVDGKQVKTRFSTAYMEMETHKIFSEIPEGREAAEFASTLSGRVRNDQTGAVYECAHDVEDAPYTYTEVFPNPRQLSEINMANYGGEYNAHLNTRPYPDYASNVTYAQGDKVFYDNRIWESDFDENLGNNPNTYGWSYYQLFVEEYPEPDYVTIEEFNAIIDEMAAEAAAEAEAEQAEGEG